MRSEMERENKERRSDIQRQERRLLQKEENLDRKIESFEKKEEHLAVRETFLSDSQAKVDALYQKQLGELERLSGLSTEDAKKELLQSVEEEVKHETAMLIKDLEQQAKEEADKKAREIISLAIQRCAADHVAETTVSVVALPVKKHTEIEKSVYSVHIVCDYEKLEEFMKLPAIEVEKKTKKGITTLDIKTFTEVKDYERGHFALIMPSGCDFTLNPSLFFDAFEKYSGEETERLDIVRTGILCKDGTQFE